MQTNHWRTHGVFVPNRSSDCRRRSALSAPKSINHQLATFSIAIVVLLAAIDSVHGQATLNGFIDAGHSLSTVSRQNSRMPRSTFQPNTGNAITPTAFPAAMSQNPPITANQNRGATVPGYSPPNTPSGNLRNWRNVPATNPYPTGNLPSGYPRTAADPPPSAFSQPATAYPPVSAYPQSSAYPPPTYPPPSALPFANDGMAIPETYRAVPCLDCIHVWKLFPDDLLFKSYLAGPLESRLGQMWYKDEERGSWVWDAAIGGRMGLFRKGTFAPYVSDGWQLDIEGAVFPRFDLNNDGDLESAVFRWGVPLTYRNGRTGLKIGTYHMRAHLGDEFLARVPGSVRNNYEKSSFILGTDYYISDDARIYGEVGYAFVSVGAAEQWEFQFGGEYSPAECFEFDGRPFLAVNFYLRQEVTYRDGFNAIAGWQWSNPVNGRRFRIGFQYYNGKSMQLTFLNRDEELLGFGVWYDY